MDTPPFDPEANATPPETDGVVEEVVPQTVFNYAHLGTGASEEVVLRDRIPVGDWAFVGISVRTHEYNAASGARFTIIVRGVAPSAEDGADFVTANLASFTLGGVAPFLQQFTVPLTDLQVPFLRVVLEAQGPTVSPGLVYCEISCDVVLKAE